MKYGIDVSHHNTITNFEEISKYNDFMIIRAGYGKSENQIDKKFIENIKNASNFKIPYGIYWYSYALSVADAEKEADACINILKKNDVKNTFPVFYDVEDESQTKLSNNTINEIIKVFINKLEKAGFTAGLYSYKNFIKNRIDLSQIKYIWFADCTTTSDIVAMNYTIHQCSFKGIVKGIKGNVDLDKMTDENFYNFVYSKEIDDLQKYIDTHDITAYDALRILKAVADRKGSEI